MDECVSAGRRAKEAVTVSHYHYLIVYDRPQGELVQFERFTDGQEALSHRFALERAFRDNPDLEIVVLGADSAGTLTRTHGRYFHEFART
jgi:hypothetical protein